MWQSRDRQLRANCGRERLQQLELLFDHLVGAGEKGRRHIEPKRLCRLQVDHQLVLGRSLHGKVGWLLTLEDAIDVARCPPELVEEIRPPAET
jgi:hypothetical protein